MAGLKPLKFGGDNMIRIIRNRNTQSGPVGEVIDFDSGYRTFDAKDACNFLWGKDLNNYFIFRDGLLMRYEDGDLLRIERDLSRVSY